MTKKKKRRKRKSTKYLIEREKRPILSERNLIIATCMWLIPSPLQK